MVDYHQGFFSQSRVANRNVFLGVHAGKNFPDAEKKFLYFKFFSKGKFK